VNYSYTVGSGIASVASSSAIISGSVDILAKFTISNMEYTVTSIGDFAFHVKQNITNVTIPNTITSIGIHVFELCTSLTSITIPSSVTTIGNNAFNACSGLATIILQSNLANFKEAFIRINNANLNVTLNYVGAILDGMFYNFDKLTTITIGPNITSIGSQAFYNNNQLKSITIPSSVTSIGASAFQDCSSLTSIIIPSSVTSVGDYAFSGTGLTNIICNTYLVRFGFGFFGLNNVNLQITFDYVGAIPDGACNGRSNLKSVTIGSGITSIGTSAFQNCSTLSSIIIPSSVTTIGTSAFTGCSTLSSIIIPSSVTTIGTSAFYNCSSLKSVYFLGNIPTIATNNFTITGDTAYHITGATNITRLSMFTTKTSFSLLQMYTLIGYIQPSPVITSITTSDGTVSINFTQLKNLKIPTITNYAYSTDGINYIDLSPAQISSSLQITDTLNIGQTYSFTIKAYNGIYSDASNSVSVKILSSQPAPVITSETLTSGNNTTAKIYFTQNTNNGNDIISYFYSIDNGTTFTDLGPSNKTSPLQISGLTNGQTYSFIIKSYNELYSNNSNTLSNVFINYPQPAPVITSETLTSGENNTCKIYFTQSTNDANAIISYFYSIDNGTTFTDLGPSNKTSPLQITELTNGQTYSFIIKAYNGLYSNNSNTVSNIFINYPQPAPVITTETLTSGENNVGYIYFTQSTNNAKAIISYFYSIDNGTTFTDLGSSNKTTPLKISGLTNGQTYSFIIKSYNGLITNPMYSNNSNTVSDVFINYPQPAPVITKLVNTIQGLDVTFTQAINNPRNKPITEYYVNNGTNTIYTSVIKNLTNSITEIRLPTQPSGKQLKITLKSFNGLKTEPLLSEASNVFTFTQAVAMAKVTTKKK
jgi:hemin uptake protein HemP